MALAPTDWDAEAFFELHWLIKGLGQAICTDASPQCGRCPLKASCPRIDVGVGRGLTRSFLGAAPVARNVSASD